MGRLPPAEKLPLALRKNIRDEWDNKKADLEKDLSEALGTEWTLTADPLQLYVYASDGWAKDSLGSVIYQYMNDAISRIKYFLDNYGEDGKNELNEICHAHVMTLDEDDQSRFSYCGCDVADGTLRVLFSKDKMGTNIYDALSTDVLLKALNNAPPAPGSDSPISFSARTSIRKDYDPEIEAIRTKAAEMLEKPDLVFDPAWAANFAALKEAAAQKGSSVRDDWETTLGSLMKLYFEGFVGQLSYQKFGEDEMLREGFNEAVEKGVVAFRVVEKLKYDSYCECEIEDGVLYLQCVPGYFGTNVDYAAQKLMDRL